MWERGCRADEGDGVAGDGAFGGGDVGAIVGTDGDADEFDAKVLGGFVECGVGGGGDDEFGVEDAFVCFGPVAVCFDGKEDAFGAARGDGAAGVVWFAAEHVRRHGDDFGFKFGCAGPEVGVQGVAL